MPSTTVHVDAERGFTRGVVGVGLILAAVSACARVEPLSPGTGSATLMRNLARARSVEIVVAPGPIERTCWREAVRIARERGGECLVLSPAQRGDPGAARIVVGGPADAHARSLVERLGLQPGEEAGRPAFRCRDEAFSYPADAVVAVLADPERPGLPLTLVYGNDLGSLQGYLPGLEPGWKPWVRVYRAGDAVFSGPVAQSGAIVESRLEHDGARRFLVTASFVPILTATAGLATTEGPPGRAGFSGTAAREIDAAVLDAYLDSLARARRRTAEWAAAPEADGGAERAARQPLALVLHAHAESLATATGTTSLSVLNPVASVVHALVSGEIGDDAGQAGARDLARALLGRPAEDWLEEAAAVHAASRWWGRDLEEWIARLLEAGPRRRAADLVDTSADPRVSAHVLVPLRAGLFRCLLQARGADAMRRLWRGEASLSGDPALETDFAAWLTALYARHPREPASEREAARGALFLGGPLKGVEMEEPGSDPARGYGSLRYEESLTQARAIGANAIAISTFAADDPDPPRGGDFGRPRGFAPLRGDLRLFAALRVARARGFRTLVRPRLLAAPTGTLAGTGPQGGEGGWARFFDGYERFTTHFALLSELAGADGLSIGGGTLAVTRGRDDGRRARPEEELWRRQGWARVIRASRGAFPRTLTCCAGTLIEARELSFWSELDAVACDQTEELDDRAVTGRKDPRQDLEIRIGTHLFELGRIAARHGKPLILTGAGFGAAPRVSGVSRRGAGAVDPEVQALEFDILDHALRGGDEAHGLRGVFLWRWSTDPRDDGVNERDWLLRTREAREAAARVLAGL